jgi:hypothetical protein
MRSECLRCCIEQLLISEMCTVSCGGTTANRHNWAAQLLKLNSQFRWNVEGNSTVLATKQIVRLFSYTYPALIT